MKRSKQCILFFTTIILALSLCACTDSERDDTGGDTDIGGLFWDILHGVRGDEPAQEEQTVIIDIHNDTDG